MQRRLQTRSDSSPRRHGTVPRWNFTVKWNCDPLPSSLSKWIRPPMISTSLWEIVSPRPVPPYSRVVDVSAWLNDSKTRSNFSGAMPMPVSATTKCTRYLSSSRPEVAGFHHFVPLRTQHPDNHAAADLIVINKQYPQICKSPTYG
jgi:hypothetical protein